MRGIWQLLKQTYSEWQADKAPRLAAALAYYTVFSLPPLLVILLAIAGLVLSGDQVRQALVNQFSQLVTPSTAQAIGAVIDNVGTSPSGPLATAISFGLLLLGASGVFGQLQESLNVIWKVKSRPGLGWRAVVQKRLFSFLMVLAVGFLLLVSLVLSAALTVLGSYLLELLPGSARLIQVGNEIIAFLVIMLFFGLMFRYMPDAITAWRDVWLGAAITSGLFSLGKQLISLLLARSSVADAFGAAASVILILAWVYYTAQILFLGAEFTQVYANQFGTGTVPEPHAIRTTDEERIRQGLAPDAGQGPGANATG
jgi:membrane protein